MAVVVFVCVFALENVWGSIAVLDRQKRDQAFFGRCVCIWREHGEAIPFEVEMWWYLKGRRMYAQLTGNKLVPVQMHPWMVDFCHHQMLTSVS